MVQGPKFESYDGGKSYVPDSSVIDLTQPEIVKPPAQQTQEEQQQGQNATQTFLGRGGVSPEVIAESQAEAWIRLGEVQAMLEPKSEGDQNNG